MSKKIADVDLQGFYDECVETLPWSDIDNWESDLYIKSTPQSDYLVSKYGLKDEALFSMFVSEGAVWYEIPFGYMPFWEKLSKTAVIDNTFFQDFSIADMFGPDAVQDTFNRAFREWKNDYEYLTALVIALNHKIWQHYESNPQLAKLYNDLWEQADAYACDNLKGDELRYFYSETD